MITAPPPPPWMPREHTFEVLPCGRWWDAISTPQIPGLRILGQLVRLSQGPVGPVIWNPDPKRARLYFLVSHGAVGPWLVPGVVVLGEGFNLVVPALSKAMPPGPHWIEPPAADAPAELVDSALLARACRGVA